MLNQKTQMQTFRCALALSLFVCLKSSFVWADFELSSEKEKVVSLLLTPGDHNIAAESKRHRDTLKACGYDVVEINSGTISQINKSLEAAHLPPGTVVIVDSHGQAFLNGHFSFMREGAPGPTREAQIASLPEYRPPSGSTAGTQLNDFVLFSGQELMNTVVNQIRAPRVWLDTCYAGFCPIPEGCKVGQVCAFTSASSQVADVTSILVDLMCSRKLDCALWRKVDRNGDGIVSGKEFETELKTRAGSTQNISVLASLVAKDSPGYVQFKNNCLALGGEVQEENVGFPLEVRQPHMKNGKLVLKVEALRLANRERLSSETRPAPEEAVTKGQFTEDYFAKSVSEARKIASDAGAQPLDVVQLMDEPHVKLKCVKKLPMFQNSNGSKKGQTPDVGGFDLEAKNCAEAERGERNKGRGDSTTHSK